jgi:hypothetical protein
VGHWGLRICRAGWELQQLIVLQFFVVFEFLLRRNKLKLGHEQFKFLVEQQQLIFLKLLEQFQFIELILFKQFFVLLEFGWRFVFVERINRRKGRRRCSGR